jgi:hypothetical protein
MSGNQPKTALDEDTLLVWSSAWGLGHSRDRIGELLPGVNAQIADMAALWQIDAAEYEPISSPPRWRGARDDR